MPLSFEQKWQLLDHYAEAGITAVSLSIANEETTTEQALTYLAKIRRHIFAHPEKYLLATTQADIKQAKREAKLAIRLMFQGTHPVGNNLTLLELFYALGVSSMVVAYNVRGPMGDGVIEKDDAGLSHLGEQLIAEMNRIGMIPDGSHASRLTTLQAMQISTKPFVFSHSCISAVQPHLRNLTDEQILAVAKTGGVIGINGIGILLGDSRASISRYADHIDHIKCLVGSEYAAIGLDHLYFADQFEAFMENQPVTHPKAYAEAVKAAADCQCVAPESLIYLVDELLARHYSESEILGILGGNLLKLLA